MFLVLSEDNISSYTKIRRQLGLIVRVGTHLCKGAGEKNRYDERFKSNAFPSQ